MGMLARGQLVEADRAGIVVRLGARDSGQRPWLQPSAYARGCASGGGAPRALSNADRVASQSRLSRLASGERSEPRVAVGVGPHGIKNAGVGPHDKIASQSRLSSKPSEPRSGEDRSWT